MSGLLPNVVEWASDVAYSFGYLGIAFLVMLGNLHLPVPTELTLPLAGFLVGQGRFSFFPALVWTTVAAVASSLVLYFPGRWFGEERLRRFVGRFGPVRVRARVGPGQGERIVRSARRESHPDRTTHTRCGYLNLCAGGHLPYANLRVVLVLDRPRQRRVECSVHRVGVGTRLAMDARGAVRKDRGVRGAGRLGLGDLLVPVAAGAST